MSAHIDSLERLATRGTPRGADTLLRDLRDTLNNGPRVTVRPEVARRRPSGPIWATIVATVVLVLGLVGGWIAGFGDGVSTSDVSWHRVNEPETAAMVASGPGGFVSIDLLTDSGAWYSADGVSWTQSRPFAGGGAFIESILSTDDRWLIIGFLGDDRVAWWSDDGRSWTELVWPGEFADTIQGITSTRDYFFVLSRDVFEEGTTLWRSGDAQTWSEVPTGPVTGTSGYLEGTDGGLVLRDEADVSVSKDGNTWTTATLTSPAELGEGRVHVHAVEYLGNRWVAFVEVVRVGQNPVLAVMSSGNGASWRFEGIPPFAQLDDLAPGLQATDTFGDRLVAIPVQTPTSTQDDGTVVANGFVRNSREIWSTTDTSEWVLELSEDQDIIAADGAVLDGRPVGIWIGRGNQTADAENTGQDRPVVTTTPRMPDEPIDSDGLAFQQTIIEDGTVTLEEFKEAVEHWKACMEKHGVTDVEYTIDRAGGWSASYASPSPNGDVENAIDNLCQESWVSQVSAKLAGY